MEPTLKKYKGATFDDLCLFMQWPALSVDEYYGCRSVIIEHQWPEWLVIERICFPPNIELPAHRHPNVSVLDFGFCGSGEFSVRGHKFSNSEADRAALPLYVPRNTPHGGKVGPNGATIVSFQYWYEWPPKASIFLDWERA